MGLDLNICYNFRFNVKYGFIIIFKENECNGVFFLITKWGIGTLENKE